MSRVCNGVLILMAVVVSLSFLLPSLAWAELYVCGDASTFTQAFYRDPSLQRPGNCSLVPQAQVETQLAVIASVQPPAMTPARYDYLKVPSGLVMQKTQAEKDAVDAKILEDKQAQDALKQERATNIFCNQEDVNAGTNAIAQRKQVLYDKVDQIQAVNVATMKAGLKQVVDELATISTLTVNCFTGRKAGS